jgi:hypothetical protein
MELTNKQFAEQNEEFRKACEKLELKPTTRQASKWQMKKGKAWKEGRGV